MKLEAEKLQPGQVFHSPGNGRVLVEEIKVGRKVRGVVRLLEHGNVQTAMVRERGEWLEVEA